MKAIISPSFLNGEIVAAASKSSMQRACAAALVAGGITRIINPGHSNDDKAALSVIQALGANIAESAGLLEIDSSGVHARNNSMHCGESGLGIRMFTPIAALSPEEILITGVGSLVTRPMDFFDTVLPQVGVRTQTKEGKLPLVIQGPLKPENITIDGSLSSQFLTGMLLSYAAAGAKNVTIQVTNLKSKPYVDLTLNVMESFGFILMIQN
jgi:3-phosphoshikimate 1-carboxyvinyltransferase